MRPFQLFLVVMLLLLLTACGSPAPEPDVPVEETPPVDSSMEMTAEPVAELVDPDAEFSPLKYFDTGMETLNDRCPVRKIPLNPKIQAVYVNGRPIGFC